MEQAYRADVVNVTVENALRDIQGVLLPERGAEIACESTVASFLGEPGIDVIALPGTGVDRAKSAIIRVVPIVSRRRLRAICCRNAISPWLRPRWSQLQ